MISWSLTQLKTLWIGGRPSAWPDSIFSSSFWDMWVLFYCFPGVVVMRAEDRDRLIFGAITRSYLNHLALSWVGKEIISDCRVMVSVFRFMQTIFVDRQSLESRRAAVAEIRRRTTGPGWPRWGPWWPRWWWWSWHWPPPITIMVIQKSAFWDQEGDYWTRVANYDIDYLCWMA